MLRRTPDEPVPSSEPSLVGDTAAGRRTGMYVKLGIGVVVAVAVVLLIVQNGESAQLDWFLFDFRTPLWIMLVLTATAGAVVWEAVKVAVRRARGARHAGRAARRVG